VLEAIPQNQLLRYGPLRISCFSTMGHSAGSGSTLLATALIPVLCYTVSVLNWIRIRSHVSSLTMHPRARGHVSTCTWLCITHAPCHLCPWSHNHAHGAVYPHAEFSYSLWALVQNIVKFYSPQSRILLCAHATAQNFVMCYKPTGQNYVKGIGHGAESMTRVQIHTNLI
jgi:hypothetical protein